MNFYRKYEKAFLILFTICIWCICYFGINIISRYRETHILALPFEKHIPFVPFFVVFYMLTYVIIFVVIIVVKDIQNFRRAAIAYFIVIGVSSVFYLVYPVETMRPDIVNPTTIFLKLLASVYTIAEPYNLFPSLHVGLTTLSLLIAWRFHKITTYILVPFVTLIIASTLFLKQHYVVDLIAAIILSSFAYYIVFVKKVFDRWISS